MTRLRLMAFLMVIAAGMVAGCHDRQYRRDSESSYDGVQYCEPDNCRR